MQMPDTPSTLASGPNALLFGLGNPGGITDASLSTANFLRNRTRLAYRRDNFASHRFSFDSNFVVRPKVAALRIATVDADNRTFRSRAWSIARPSSACATPKSTIRTATFTAPPT
jgi:hypothetical protein